MADNANNIVWKWESSPFGESKPTGTYTLNLRFPGQYFDSESGTHYNINRDYNPVTGRYIQSDPIGFDGGVNGFVYVDGKPLIRIDREGLQTNFKVTSITGVIGEGGSFSYGTYDDWNYATGLRRKGNFISYGDAWGLDIGVSGGNGVIWGDNSYNKFIGWSKTWAVDLFFASGAYIEDMNGNYIGFMYGIGGKLGASYAVSYTWSTSEHKFYDYN